MAEPKVRDARLTTENQAKKREADGRTITYFASVFNVGSVGTNFDLIGGGLT